MSILSSIDPDKAQSRLNQHFDSFREEYINGVPFGLMPKRQDIPLVKKVAYDAREDMFEIVFQYEANVSKKKNDEVVFIENASGALVGIQIEGVKKNGIEEVRIEVLCNKIDNAIQAAKIGFKKQNQSALEAANSDIEKRKVDFFKDVIRQDLSNLVTA